MRFHESNFQKFKKKILAQELLSKKYYSRVHSLRTYSNIWIQRDDELSFGVSGSKWRKYISLIPYFKKQKIEVVFVIGGAASNNLLAAAQLFTEAGICVVPVVCRPHAFLGRLEGNAAWTNLIIPQKNWILIERENWLQVENLLKEGIQGRGILKEVCAPYSAKCLEILSEGANHPASLPGVATLSYTIVENLYQDGVDIVDLWLDGGTLATATITAIILSWLECPIQINIVGMVKEVIPEWAVLVDKWEEIFRRWMEEGEDSIELDRGSLSSVRLLPPITSAAFGSTNSTIWKIIKEMASREGIFLDPIYSAKLFATLLHYQEKEGAPSLLVHSGGALSLSGQLDKRREV